MSFAYKKPMSTDNWSMKDTENRLESFMPLGKPTDWQSFKLHTKQTVTCSVNFHVNESSEYSHSVITQPSTGLSVKLEQNRENPCPHTHKTYNLVGDLENKMINYNTVK